MVMSDRWRMSPSLRRTSAVVAITALAIGGAKVASDHTMPGSGFSTLATVAADPTGPTGGPGGDGGMNGSQFSPPSMPNSMPDYQGGNQPPLNQDNGISIYQTGAQGSPQQGGQSSGQQPQQGWDQPARGTQPPNYSTAPGYTQGPGKPNPDFQAPQQQSPQQGQQPSQAPTQTQQPEQPQSEQGDTTQQMDQEDEFQRCLAQFIGGGGSLFDGPSLDPIFQADGSCSDCDRVTPRQFNRNCEEYSLMVSAKMPMNMPCGYIYDPQSKITPKEDSALHDYCTSSPSKWGTTDFAPACARHDMCYQIARPAGLGLGPCNDRFKDDLRAVCDTLHTGASNWLCHRTAGFYWSMVTLFHLREN